MKKLFAGVLLLFFAVGCVPKTAPFQPVSISDGSAVVYVYRPDSFVNRAETMDLFVNGQKIDTLWTNAYRYAIVGPGDVALMLKDFNFPYNEYGSLLLRDVKPGKEYFVVADPVPFGGFDMKLQDNAAGRAGISKTNYYINN